MQPINLGNIALEPAAIAAVNKISETEQRDVEGILQEAFYRGLCEMLRPYLNEGGGEHVQD